MVHSPVTDINAPYLVLIGDVVSERNVKTGFGVVQWARDQVAGQLRFSGNPVDLGVPDLTIDEAKDLVCVVC